MLFSAPTSRHVLAFDVTLRAACGAYLSRGKRWNLTLPGVLTTIRIFAGVYGVPKI